MDKYKIKDLKERLAKETSQEHKNKMLYMWVKQEHISLQEYNSLVKNHSVLSNVSDQRELLISFMEYLSELTMDIDSYSQEELLFDFKRNL